MKRLTISAHACTETLTLLIAMAWADGRLDDREKEGVRGASEVLNLSKELRTKLEQALAKPLPLDQILLDTLSARDKAFAYVAATWMSSVDDEVDDKEKALLDRLASSLELSAERRSELDLIAKDLSPAKDGRNWGDEIVRLFKAIPPRIEQEVGEVEVAFE
ncbi:hypothetical protein BH09MYX1_BH09MYX1_13780 [soil metagenome]